MFDINKYSLKLEHHNSIELGATAATVICSMVFLVFNLKTTYFVISSSTTTSTTTIMLPSYSLCLLLLSATE